MMKYVIVRQTIRRNLDKKPYFVHSTIVCRHPIWGNLYYGTMQNLKNMIFFSTLKEGEDFIRIWLNRNDSHFNYFDGKKVNVHVCIKFRDVDIQDKKKSKYLRPKKKVALITTKNRICEESKNKLTKQEINDNIDRLFRNAEKNRKLREHFDNISDKLSYSDINYNTVKSDKQRTSKYNTIPLTPNGRAIPQNKNTIVAKILIKDLNTGLYIHVPESGNCELVERCDCTLFSDSNQSHYIISNIHARSFMHCYHDMKLIEVYMKNDKPIRKQESDDSHEIEKHLCDIDKIFKNSENSHQ